MPPFNFWVIHAIHDLGFVFRAMGLPTTGADTLVVRTRAVSSSHGYLIGGRYFKCKPHGFHRGPYNVVYMQEALEEQEGLMMPVVRSLFYIGVILSNQEAATVTCRGS